MTARNLALEALRHSYAYISTSPHGDNCYLHDDGGEFDTCRCGKESALSAISETISALEAETGEVAAWIEPNDLAMLLKGKGREEFAGMRFAGVSDKQSKITSTALYTAPPPAVPPGWKLVPIEPTEAMWKAGLAHLFRDVDAVWRAMLAEVPDATVSTVSQWIPVTERMPVGGCKVFVFYRNSYGLGRRTCAHYAPLHTIDASHWEDGEPDETEDGVFEPKGWWEEQVEAGQVTFISDEVTHWMPLPEAPK